MVGEVADHQKFLPVQLSCVDKEFGIFSELQFVMTVNDDVVCVAQFDQFPVVVLDRILADDLLRHIDLYIIRVHGEPGLSGRKAGVR